MSNFYDSGDTGVKTMPERLREYYDPQDFVMIMNIDTEDFGYTIQRPENVNIHQPSAVTKELYYAKDPDVITLKPGETRMAPAYEADWMIDQLVKKLVLRNRGKFMNQSGQLLDPSKVPTESATDSGTQHKYIKQIFQGKRDFMSEYNQQSQPKNDAIADLEKELDNEPTSRHPGRPKKQVA